MFAKNSLRLGYRGEPTRAIGHTFVSHYHTRSDDNHVPIVSIATIWFNVTKRLESVHRSRFSGSEEAESRPGQQGSNSADGNHRRSSNGDPVAYHAELTAWYSQRVTHTRSDDHVRSVSIASIWFDVTQRLETINRSKVSGSEEAESRPRRQRSYSSDGRHRFNSSADLVAYHAELTAWHSQHINYPRSDNHVRSVSIATIWFDATKRLESVHRSRPSGPEGTDSRPGRQRPYSADGNRRFISIADPGAYHAELTAWHSQCVNYPRSDNHAHSTSIATIWFNYTKRLESAECSRPAGPGGTESRSIRNQYVDCTKGDCAVRWYDGTKHRRTATR